MNFDLISDLHLDYWTKNTKDWKGLGTSLYCVVAGDVSRNPRLTAGFLKHLSDAYQHVMFVDGNHEHNNRYDTIQDNENEFEELFSKISNLTYLSNSSCIIDDVAFIGTNGWWTFDFGEGINDSSRADAMKDYCARTNWSMKDAIKLWDEAQYQAEFMMDAVSTIQTEESINEIVVVTHTVPRRNLVPTGFAGTLSDWAKLGNSFMEDVLKYDSEGKISTWCFGHFHEIAFDQVIEGVRYISHPRGKPSDAINSVYYPKLVDTDQVTISAF